MLSLLWAVFGPTSSILEPTWARWNWKIIAFLYVFIAFLLCRHSCKNGGQVAPTWGAVFHTWSQNDPHVSRLVLNFVHIGSTWRYLGTHMGGPGAILGPTWANFGARWGQLTPSRYQLELHSHWHGPIMFIFGSTCSHLKAILAPNWGVLDHSVIKFTQIPSKINQIPWRFHQTCMNIQAFAVDWWIPHGLKYS